MKNGVYYEFSPDALGAETLKVVSFKGEENVSRLFSYKFDLISPKTDINPADILNKGATFFLHLEESDHGPTKIHGIVSHFEQHGKTKDFVFYSAVLVPAFWRSTLTYQSVVYQDVNVQELIQKVLEDSGYKMGTDFTFKLSGSYPTLEYVVQYKETDFDFINRRLEHYGIFYYFDHSNGNDMIVFADANNSFGEIKGSVNYDESYAYLGSGTAIGELTFQQKVVSGKVMLNDYNYRHPETSLVVEKPIDSKAPGVFYDYGAHYKNESEGNFLAEIRKEEIICWSKLFKGTSDCHVFKAGYAFEIGRHYRDDWNARYILTGVDSVGDQRQVFPFLNQPEKAPPVFQNTFTAISEDQVFRPKKLTEIPRIHGIMTAKLESGVNDEYAYVDDHGRYKVKVPFDLNTTASGEASREVRMSQPYSGPDYGMHFPNHKDSEMLWSCIDGDPDRIIGLGTIYNSNNPSPVVATNKKQNVLRTKARNELIMDDTSDKTWILLKSTDANQMKFDDENDNIKITSTNKHVVILDDKNENLNIQTTSGHFLIFDDKNKKVTCQSKDGHRISINDADKNITLVDESGENMFVIDIANKKLVIKTENGDIDMHAPNGTIDIKATTLNIETSGDTTMKAANIQSEAQQDHNIKATNFSTEASMDHKAKGMNVSSEASMEHKSKGMNVTSEAGVQQNVKGTMVTVQASGINTIQGSLVKIN